MNSHLEKYLIDKYPKILVDMYGDMSKTCMAWGIDTGDGWFHLVDTMFSYIQGYLDQPVYAPKKGLVNRMRRIVARVFIFLGVPHRFTPYPEWEYQPRGVEQVVALQVKEKLGTLTFYYSGGDDYIRSIVDFAEYLSGTICENCGAMNEYVGHTKGWIQTVCARCLSGNQIPNQKWSVRNPDISSAWQKVAVEKEERPSK